MSGPFRFLSRTFPASLAEVEVLALQLRALLAGNERWAGEGFKVELLAREALCNAVRHGCREDGVVSFTCRLGSRRIVLKVEDEGSGFDWRARLDRPGDEMAGHGRGLALYRLYASCVLFNARGNRVLLVRQLPEPPMSDPSPVQEEIQALIHPGDLTAATVDPVRARLKALLEGGVQRITLDLAGVTMVDSMGIGLLIQAHNSLARAGGGLVVVHASRDLLELFRSMRLDKRFTIQD